MSLTKNEQKALLALVGEYQENPRPISTLIVMAACNASAGHQQDAMLVALSSLKRQGLVEMRGDAWWPTWDGRGEVLLIEMNTRQGIPEPEPLAEAPPVRPKSRDALRPRQLTAPRPVTRPEPSPDFVCQECGALPGQRHHSWCTAHRHEFSATSADHFRDAKKMISSAQEEVAPMPGDLLHRCAAMSMALMADARQRYETTHCPEALSEISWLAETGRLLLQAGGEA